MKEGACIRREKSEETCIHILLRLRKTRTERAKGLHFLRCGWANNPEEILSFSEHSETPTLPQHPFSPYPAFRNLHWRSLKLRIYCFLLLSLNNHLAVGIGDLLLVHSAVYHTNRSTLEMVHRCTKYTLSILLQKNAIKGLRWGKEHGEGEEEGGPASTVFLYMTSRVIFSTNCGLLQLYNWAVGFLFCGNQDTQRLVALLIRNRC